MFECNRLVNWSKVILYIKILFCYENANLFSNITVEPKFRLQIQSINKGDVVTCKAKDSTCFLAHRVVAVHVLTN